MKGGSNRVSPLEMPLDFLYENVYRALSPSRNYVGTFKNQQIYDS